MTDNRAGLWQDVPRARALVCALLAASAGAGLGASTGAQATTVQADVVDEAGRPVGGAVVFLESAAARAQVKPLALAEMAQEKKQFLPGVLVVPVGTQVHFPNRDTVRHHVYSFSPAKKFELKLYAGTPANPVLFDQPGVVSLGCNIHDRMVGWILVVDTPYYAQAPEGPEGLGRALVQNVPAGSYKLRVWHPRLAPGAAAHEQAVVVPAAGTVQAAVKMTGLAP
jgi:plastocyanin